MPTTLTLVPQLPADLNDANLMLIGRKAMLRGDAAREVASQHMTADVWTRMLKAAPPGDHGATSCSFVETGPSRVYAAVLPERVGRGNSQSRAWAIPALTRAAGRKGRVVVVAILDDEAHAFATVAAVARACPKYSEKTTAVDCQLQLVIIGPNGAMDIRSLAPLAQGVQYAAAWVDTAPNQMTVERFVEESQRIDSEHANVSLELIRGEDLRDAGLGGIWGVGKAAECPPALICLDYTPDAPTRHSAWVGKGIVFDTGGLSIKGKTSMPSMKMDMGGAAAMLAAFDAAAKMGAKERISCILCVAENAVGPASTRPDDILHMYSGKTVEVNNTDAEGRLVLADGVAWAVKHKDPDRIIDMATLTGAQGVSTGRHIAALVCNDEALERAAVLAGQGSGELCHPLPYVPEFHRKEFRSQVADMKNSVKDRGNAQSSCAGYFVSAHLGPYTGPWLHVDMAGPAMSNGRGTGYGVGLLLALSGLGPTS
jgi:probable aminopeptidase NPEPL1